MRPAPVFQKRLDMGSNTCAQEIYVSNQSITRILLHAADDSAEVGSCGQAGCATAPHVVTAHAYARGATSIAHMAAFIGSTTRPNPEGHVQLSRFGVIWAFDQTA